MEVDWFEWFRNITSVSGILFILRYIAIGAKDGFSRVWKDCVARDRIKLRMRAIEQGHNYRLERDYIRYVSARGANRSQFRRRRG